MIRRIRSQLGVCVLLTSTAGVALAHSGATGIVKQRMDHMKGIGEATKAIAQMIQGKTEWDTERLRYLAENLSAAGGTTMTDLFPQNSIFGPSEARPRIWTEWKRFKGIAADMKTKSDALAAGAENARDGGSRSPDQLFAAVAQTCKSCHKDFRIEK